MENPEFARNDGMLNDRAFIRTRPFVIALSLLSILGSERCNATVPRSLDLKKAEQIAREVAEWFDYTTGKMDSEHLGQCGDYALRFVLQYNALAGENVARLVIANNPVPSGTYRVEERVDIASLGIPGFDWDSSGLLTWDGQTYLFHPVLGTYRITLEKSWTPKRHFGVDMLDPAQVHVWAALGDTSVDPTYIDSWPDRFPSPLGKDE